MKRFLLLCALVIAAASCGGYGGDSGTRASSTPSSAQTFSKSDLAKIALQEDQEVGVSLRRK